MNEWFVYQPSGQHIGPLSTEALARGLATGKVPRDAHVARAGTTSWQLVTAVAELASARPDGPVSPTVPPAPPPRATLPPAAVALESTLPSKKRGVTRRDNGVPPMVIPASLFGGCFLVAVAVAITSLVALPQGGEGPSAHATILDAAMLLACLATLAIPPESARVRVTVAAVLLVAAFVSAGLAACVAQSLSVALSALVLRFADLGREQAAERAYLVAWGLVPGVALIAWVSVLFKVV